MEKLIADLKDILKKNIDAEHYAEMLVSEATEDHFEVRGFDTQTGVPYTNYLSIYGIAH